MEAAGNPRDESLAPASTAPGALPPLVSAALGENVRSLPERLELIAAHSPHPSRYTVLGEIAGGAMGRVLRVWDEDLQRELAMKVVAIEPEDDAEPGAHDRHHRGVARFVEEARITGQLDHPGIVPVHEVAVDDVGHIYFTMPLVRGKNLKQVIELVRTGAEGWTLHRALGVIHKVCLAVAFAHAKGVLHRDLKPENVMIGRFGEVYVMDWGLALVQGRRDRAVVGTPAYMSPEQAGGGDDKVGPTTDVYSIGAILYELLGRHIPHELSYHDLSPEERRIADVIVWPPRPLSEIAPDVPPELTAICEKAMAAAPEERYADMMEMADDLEAWLEGRVVHAYETGTWARIRKWRERNRGLSRALQGLAALLLISVIVVVFLQQSRIRAVNAKNREVLQHGYVANVSAADFGLRAFETGQAKRRLAACPPELRGWEWDHLKLLSDVSTDVLGESAFAVRAVAASDDGALLATATDDGTIRLWDGATGRPLRTLEGHEGVVRTLDFGPSRELLVSSSDDGSVRLWDTRIGKELRRLEAPLLPTISVSADGKQLASGELDGTLRVWSLDSLPPLDGGEPPTKIETTPINALVYDPATGRLLSGHSEGFVRVWQPPATDFAVQRFLGDAVIRSLVTDARGTIAAAATGDEVVLLEPRTLTPLLPPLRGHEQVVTAVAIDRNASRVLTASADETIRLWDAVSGTHLATFLGHDEEVNDLAFLDDGKRFVSVSEDGTVRLWNVDVRAELTLAGHEDWVTALSFREDGERLISGSRDETLRVWDVDDGGLLARIDAPGIVDCVAYGEGDHIAFGSGGPMRLGRADQATLWRVLEVRAGLPRSVVQHPASDTVFVRDWESVQVWRASTGESLLEVEETYDDAGSLAVHPDGRSFAVGDGEGKVRLRDTSSGDVLAELQGPRTLVTTLAYGRNGELLACGTDRGTVVIWDLATRSIAHELPQHDAGIMALAFHPSGRRLASASVDDTIRIWDPDSGEPLLTLRGHQKAVTAVCFSPDGDLLASGSKDGTVRLWRTRAPDVHARTASLRR